MGKKHWEKFVSNNGTFKKTDTIYREVYFINALWIVGISISIYFALINYFLFHIFMGTLFNLILIGSVLSVMAYFHITSDYETASMVTVISLIVMMSLVFYYFGHVDYVLVWGCLIPPVVHSLLSRKKAALTVMAFAIYLFFLIYYNFYHWEGQGFNLKAVQNIFGIMIAIVFVMRYFERSRTDAIVALEIKNRQLEKVSITDGLTGLFNRTKIDTVLEDEISRASRGGHPFSVIMIDIDHFKSINDRFGHLTGDQHLITVAQIMRDTCRQLDSIGRWGGEEFLIVCPETDEAGASTLANKLLKSIQDYPFESEKMITFSIGISSYKPLDTTDSLILRTDKALYQAKHNGRNRVEVSDEYKGILE